jgi:hypothetical protein
MTQLFSVDYTDVENNRERERPKHTGFHRVIWSNKRFFKAVGLEKY